MPYSKPKNNDASGPPFDTGELSRNQSGNVKYKIQTIKSYSNSCLQNIENVHPFQLPVQKDKKRHLFRFGRKKSEFLLLHVYFFFNNLISV